MSTDTLLLDIAFVARRIKGLQEDLSRFLTETAYTQKRIASDPATANRELNDLAQFWNGLVTNMDSIGEGLGYLIGQHTHSVVSFSWYHSPRTATTKKLRARTSAR